MDDITRLFRLSFCMLVGCYVAGAIPLARMDNDDKNPTNVYTRGGGHCWN